MVYDIYWILIPQWNRLWFRKQSDEWGVTVIVTPLISMDFIAGVASPSYPRNPTILGMKVEGWSVQMTGHTYNNTTSPDQSSYCVYIGKVQNN